jgi:hypothetical protein
MMHRWEYTVKIDCTELRALLAANPATDFRLAVLDDEATRRALDFGGFSPDVALPLLEAYQRLLRVLPSGEEQRALPLLEIGLHSAIQIAGIPRHEFERRWAELFPGEEALAVTVHRTAQSRRGVLLHRHMNVIQHNEPHYRTARFK